MCLCMRKSNIIDNGVDNAINNGVKCNKVACIEVRNSGRKDNHCEYKYTGLRVVNFTLAKKITACGDRTRDIVVKSHTLYQLS